LSKGHPEGVRHSRRGAYTPFPCVYIEGSTPLINQSIHFPSLLISFQVLSLNTEYFHPRLGLARSHLPSYLTNSHDLQTKVTKKITVSTLGRRYCYFFISYFGNLPDIHSCRSLGIAVPFNFSFLVFSQYFYLQTNMSSTNHHAIKNEALVPIGKDHEPTDQPRLVR
jgi:hypothetical protein